MGIGAEDAGRFEVESGGVPFTARIVGRGDRYGMNWCLTNDGAEPLIEFYDRRFPHTELGQFVSRYHASTLGNRMGIGGGLCLDAGVPAWSLDAVAYGMVTEWLAVHEATRGFMGPVSRPTIHDMAEAGEAAALASMLGAGAAPDGPDDISMTPLAYAASGGTDGHREACRILLAAGADPNGRVARGRSPMHLLADAATARILIGAGGDPNLERIRGETPLRSAVREGADGTAAALIAAGADVSVTDGRGRTPLHDSATEACSALLLAAGADPNARDASGRTPLHDAVEYADDPTAAVLLAAGADPSIRDAAGMSVRDAWEALGDSAAKALACLDAWEVAAASTMGRPSAPRRI